MERTFVSWIWPEPVAGNQIVVLPVIAPKKFQLKQCGSAPAKREAFENKRLEDLLYMKTCDALRDGEGGHPPTFDYHLFLKVFDLSDFIYLDKCDENRLNDSYKCKRLEKEIRRFPLGNLLVLEV